MAFMRGTNELRINAATLKGVLDEWLARHICGGTSAAPRVTDVKYDHEGEWVVVYLEQRPEAK